MEIIKIINKQYIHHYNMYYEIKLAYHQLQYRQYQ